VLFTHVKHVDIHSSFDKRVNSSTGDQMGLDEYTIHQYGKGGRSIRIVRLHGVKIAAFLRNSL